MAFKFLSEKKSLNYKRRKELMETLELPTMSEAKELLGSRLAEIVMEECPDELKEDFGLEPPLKGPGDELWVSPSDMLIGKVCLKPPLTQKHIQALTHQGILEIGYKIEQKYRNEMRIQKEHALNKLEKYLRNTYELEKIKLLDEVREEEKAKYLEQLNCLIKYYEKLIDDRVTELTEEMVRLEVELTTENRLINEIWELKLEEEVENTVKRLNEELLEKLRDQEKLLAKIFKEKIRNLDSKKKCAIDFERTQCREALMQLRHNLECRNIANLMYVLTKERKKCQKEKKALDENYTAKIQELNKTLDCKSSIIKHLEKVNKKKAKQIRIREKCLVEILRQYQKLINFVLKSSPTQAEYLLDLEKILNLEINEFCYPKPEEKPTCDVKPRVITEQDLTMDAVETTVNYLGETATKIQAANTEEEEEVEYWGESDELPAFYFNDKMYVREDFRDMLANGMKIERNHPLWNKDVEELMGIFKNSVYSERLHLDRSRSNNQILSKTKSHPSSVHFHYDDDEEQLKETEIQQKEREQNDVISPFKSMETKKSAVSTSPQTSIIHEIKYKTASLIEAVDSLELTRSSLSGSKTIQKNKKSLQAKRDAAASDSRRSSLKTPVVADYDDFTQQARLKTQKTQSRLTLARDSIIVRISSMERKSLMAGQMESENKTKDIKPIENETKDIKRANDDEDQDLESTASLNMVGENNGTPGNKKHATSKLLLVNDSLEIIAKSITKMSTITEEPKETRELGGIVGQETRKSQLVFNLNVEEVVVEQPPPALPETSKIKKPQGKGKIKEAALSKKARCRVLGDRKTIPQNPAQFTNERINSLVNILKQDSSLIRLFTACTK